MKKVVYDIYNSDYEGNGHHAVKLRTFRKLWKHLIPFVCAMPPTNDLRWTCQVGTNCTTRAAHKSLEVKWKLLQELEMYPASKKAATR